MEIDKMVDIRMRCIEAAVRVNTSTYDIEIAAASYFKWIADIIPAPIQPETVKPDDEIPF